MTESEWLNATEPQPMLEFLRGNGKATDRKLRLFACACCRRVWKLLCDRYNRKALAVSERFADAEVTEDKLRFAWGDARRAAQVAHRQERDTAEASAMWAVSMLCEANIGQAVAAVALAARCEAYPVEQSRLTTTQKEQVLLLRDIVGNPFRPVTFDPSWRTAAVRSLAQAAYDNRQLPSGHLDPYRLAVLADALQGAGCTDAEVLGHLRSPGPHVRGCFAVDWILGKGEMVAW